MPKPMMQRSVMGFGMCSVNTSSCCRLRHGLAMAGLIWGKLLGKASRLPACHWPRAAVLPCPVALSLCRAIALSALPHRQAGSPVLPEAWTPLKPSPHYTALYQQL